MYVLKLNDTFFSGRKHASDLCVSVDPSESSLVNGALGMRGARGSVKVYIVT